MDKERAASEMKAKILKEKSEFYRSRIDEMEDKRTSVLCRKENLKIAKIEVSLNLFNCYSS